MADLRHALEAEDPPWVTSASDELREDLNRLSTGERDEVERHSTVLLEQAAAFLADQPGGRGTRAFRTTAAGRCRTPPGRTP